MLPLYKKAGEAKLEGAGNAGLWYDKFCNKWRREPAKHGNKEAWTLEAFNQDGKTVNPKLAWIKTVTGGRVGDRRQLEEASGRIFDLLESRGGHPLFYRLESDFVSGLGREHPVENGFAWHPTLGTPYLPGSSVKGLVRAWAEQWADPKPPKEDIKRIFGSESKDDRDFRVGSVVFLDALPAEPVRLKADVMTPHYAPYYQGEEPPADWHSPNPIPFLVVAQGASFVFGVLPRRAGHAGDCDTVRGWLKEALEWIGAGAKTAVGYGRFAVDVKAQKRLERERKERKARQRELEEEERRKREVEEQARGKSPLYREILQASSEEKWREDKGAFAREGVAEGWMDRIEADPQQDAVELFDGFMRQHYGDVLKDPDAKKGKKGRLKHKPRPRELAKRWLRILQEQKDA